MAWKTRRGHRYYYRILLSLILSVGSPPTVDRLPSTILPSCAVGVTMTPPSFPCPFLSPVLNSLPPRSPISMADSAEWYLIQRRSWLLIASAPGCGAALGHEPVGVPPER